MAKKTASGPPKSAARKRPAKKVAVVPKQSRTPSGGIKVRAIKKGYYGEARRREGDVFLITDAKHFSSNWMEFVDKNAQSIRTTARDGMARRHKELTGHAPVQGSDGSGAAVEDENIIE